MESATIETQPPKRKRGRPRKVYLPDHGDGPEQTREQGLVAQKKERAFSQLSVYKQMEDPLLQFGLKKAAKYALGSGTKKINELALFYTASCGVSVEGCAFAHGISRGTFTQLLEQHSRLRDIYDAGLDWGIESVANALKRKALGGDTIAMIFFLKSRAKWREHDSPQSVTNNLVMFSTQIGEDGRIEQIKLDESEVLALGTSSQPTVIEGEYIPSQHNASSVACVNPNSGDTTEETKNVNSSPNSEDKSGT